MKIVVIGGGFVGQLVQLAIPTARVLDWRKTAPANHLETRVGPQYLWEPIPGVKNSSFPVITLVDRQPPTPDSILAYKKKIGKEDDGGDWGLQFQHETTGYAAQLPVPRVEYGQQVRMVDLQSKCLGMADWSTIPYDMLVTTIPMPSFLELLITGPEYQGDFRSDPIYMTYEAMTLVANGGMTLNYLSHPDNPVYRETVTWDAFYQESLTPLMKAKRILPGKIHPHPFNEQIVHALHEHAVVSLGRFATWRPDELAHETWKHIETLQELVK